MKIATARSKTAARLRGLQERCQLRCNGQKVGRTKFLRAAGAVDRVAAVLTTVEASPTPAFSLLGADEAIGAAEAALGQDNEGKGSGAGSQTITKTPKVALLTCKRAWAVQKSGRQATCGRLNWRGRLPAGGRRSAKGLEKRLSMTTAGDHLPTARAPNWKQSPSRDRRLNPPCR